VGEGSVYVYLARMVHGQSRPMIVRSVRAVSPPPLKEGRLSAAGKYLFAGAQKLYVRGVTYGTFRPDREGRDFHDQVGTASDFAAMAAAGINAIRTYSAPPRWLLDLAADHGIRVLVGLPWEQHVTFLDDANRVGSIEEHVRAGVRACAGHPAVLAYAVGNEIPAPIVRWYGPVRVERFLAQLCRGVREEDPDALVTYVNYPSTEYLHLPFLDLVSFNVYLESSNSLQAYLARLQNLAGDRPLLLAEVGLDSQRHGEAAQAHALDWQIRTAFAGGCAGTFVFAWTDEWHRGGHDIEDWDFGLTTRDRRPKPALAAVGRAYADVPFPASMEWPRISVVVCTYNGSRTIGDTCEGLAQLDYPNYEVIVVDDGSTDTTAAIARRAGFRLISTENRGLSSARNTGLAAASGEIIAYCDDDARPDPHWLMYLAAAFQSSGHAGIGGPNITPAGDGRLAECIASAPGNPVHVLLTDEIAEHIPGCNMAFRTSALRAIGGFDPTYRVAGDDVDVCWRLQDAGETLGFCPAATVWHHRRNSIRAYWRQQVGYGRAEALLERKWPEKYNPAGHLEWNGRVYSQSITRPLMPPGRIYHGIWGAAPFQRLYEPSPRAFHFLTLMPEWYVFTMLLSVLALLATTWTPLLVALPLLAVAVAVPVLQAVRAARRAWFPTPPVSRGERVKLTLITAFLHLLQPAARLWGRVRNGLHPWRRHGRRRLILPLPVRMTVWSERPQGSQARLEAVGRSLQQQGAVFWHGGAYDRWDFEARHGVLGSARLLMTIEEHGGGTQLARFRLWPRAAWVIIVLSALFALLAAAAATQHAWVTALVLADAAAVLTLRTLYDLAGALGALQNAVRESGQQ